LRKNYPDHFVKCCTLIVLILAGCGQIAIAQLRLYPTSRTNTNNARYNDLSGARKKATQTLTLPFWDDFSNPYGLYPDTLKWLDSYSVWVNSGMGINAPTINVATFDGLDSAGLAYNPNDGLVTGYTDTLTSQPIDLSDLTLPIENRESVYLSFFYQLQGNGEAPDIGDYLRVEFKDTAGVWIDMLSIFPRDELQSTVFYDTIIKVDARFFHKAFQFRFRSYGRESGPYDTWNIDYVYLNDNRNINDNSFPERAAASSLSSLFGEYYAMPYNHFREGKSLDTVTFDVTNLKNTLTPVSINYRADAKFSNFTHTGEVVNKTSYSITLVSSEGVKGVTGIMAPFERVKTRLSTLPNPDDALQFNPLADSVHVKLRMKVISSDSVDQERAKFSPIDLRVNDTVSTNYILSDYYAYDDGVAEFTVGLVEAGNLAAYQFNMLVPQDTLIGFKVHLPPYGITSNQTMTFYIYHDENGLPGEIWQTITARIERTGANVYQTVKFNPAILVDEPRFYVGWRQPTAGNALVGLDVNNNTGDKIFVNTNGFWYQNAVINGSLMIRPVFGDGETEETQVGVEDELNIAIYPNPNSGSFYIDGYFDDLRIVNITGTPVEFNTETSGSRTFIHLNKPPGLYVLRLTKGKTTETHKIIVAR
jgi:hypothetical protein